MTKNFFKYKKGVSHYHFGANAHSEMIDYTFLLPGKNERWRESVSLFEAKWSATQRSVKIGELFPGKRVGVFNL